MILCFMQVNKFGVRNIKVRHNKQWIGNIYLTNKGIEGLFYKDIKLHFVTDIKAIIRNVIYQEKPNTPTTFCTWNSQVYEI